MPNKLKHDELFRKALEYPIVAKEFLETHLPEKIKTLLLPSTLKMEKVSFIEQNLKNSISDVLFSAKFKNTDGFIYLLLEHQSTPDHYMAFRLFKYMLNIADHYLTVKPKSKRLPLIYPLVFYNGKQHYNIPLNLWDLFENNNLAREIWTNNYQVINVHNISDSDLKKNAWSGILQFFMKHIHERDLFKRWEEITNLLPLINKVIKGEDYIELVLYYTLTKINQNDKIKLEKMLKSHLNAEKGDKIMASLAHYWEKQGIELGMEKGIEKGLEKGIEKGIGLVAKTMLKKNKSLDEISELTGLTKEQIKKLNFIN
ncbi:Rpn family recombination-promoting nuclease/putative transposase [Rickettsia endosymbiont of Orchestes rusci]|uniref:Rpn family recombination-promoting nuclease/putative transposase n=1 Tax=Rickettsia endosymbiont of Orchestes rusci TaxID=3066250 RepID=UPI00313BD806